MKSFRSRLTWRLGLVALIMGAILASSCTLLNRAPVISSLEAEKDYLLAAESGEIRVTASDPNGDELSYRWEATGGVISGQGQTAIWTAPDNADTYMITVAVSDGRGGETAMQLGVGVTPNSAPVVESLIAGRAKAKPAEFITIECLASDVDGDSLEYNWSADGGVFYGKGSATTWLAPTTKGAYTIYAGVTDSHGNETLVELPMEVVFNAPPIIESLTAESLSVVVGRSTNLECVARDPDDDELSYSWSATKGELSGEGAVVEWIATGNCGDSVTITVTVTDELGDDTSKDLDIRVRKPG
ncbi:Ig-like domain-containing protein [Chloroflexota bacterium]